MGGCWLADATQPQLLSWARRSLQGCQRLVQGVITCVPPDTCFDPLPPIPRRPLTAVVYCVRVGDVNLVTTRRQAAASSTAAGGVPCATQAAQHMFMFQRTCFRRYIASSAAAALRAPSAPLAYRPCSCFSSSFRSSLLVGEGV